VKRGLHNMLLQTMALISQIKTDVSFRTIHIAGKIQREMCIYLVS